MYQVITFLDETREKSYFYSYIVSTDTALGNITCDELPPYYDINKAQSCYWDAENSVWVFDQDKYDEIMAAIAEAERLRQEAEIMAASIPTLEELGDATVELGDMVSLLSDTVSGIKEDIKTLQSEVVAIQEQIGGQ